MALGAKHCRRRESASTTIHGTGRMEDSVMRCLGRHCSRQGRRIRAPKRSLESISPEMVSHGAEEET